MALTLPINVEALISTWLAGQAEITALVEDRVYTAIPGDPDWPLLRIHRVGGAPPFTRPLWVDRARIQFDAYGGTKAQARTLADTTRALLSERILGTHDDHGVVTAVNLGTLRYLPDDDFDPARPRYVGDAVVTTHP